MMLRQWRYYFLTATATIAFCGCSKVPDNILSEKEMQSVQYDMQIAEAIINQNPSDYPDSEHKEALYQSVFRKHKIKEALYDSSLIWYGKNLDIYMKVIERTEVDLRKTNDLLSDKLKNKSDEPHRIDSIDIWNASRSMIMEAQKGGNRLVFDIKPQNNYPSGSIFVMSFDVWGLNPTMRQYPEIRLSADQGDTIVTIRHKILADGLQETVLRTLPTKQVRRVFGDIYMEGKNNTAAYRIYLDSLSLMQFNYGRYTPKVDTLKLASDSLRLSADTIKVDSLSKAMNN